MDFFSSQILSLMLSGSELYLSNLPKTKKIDPRNLLKRTKNNLLKLLTKPTEGIEKLLSLDIEENIEIKTELNDIQTHIEAKKEAKKPSNITYSQNKFSVAEALSKLYASFVSYGKKGYQAVKANTKKVMGNVKLTMAKLIKTAERIMAQASPQWNMPYGSKLDYDCLATAVSPQGSISSEDAKYQIGYQYLKHRE